jgi:predicted ATP-grasp superfamily ATP-dependent carboligase
MKIKNPAFVFNCHYNGLAIIQDLGRRGVPVYALDSHRSVGTISRYARFLKVPNPITDEDEFVKILFNLCEKQNFKPVLFPTNDHWASAISRNKDMLEKVSYPVVSSWEGVRSVLDKELFYYLGNQNGYLTPNTWKLSMLDEIPDDEYPLVIKPRWRRMSSGYGPQYSPGILDCLRLIQIRDKNAAIKTLQKLKEMEEHLLLQTFIPGNCDQMFTVGVYADDFSNIRSIFIGKKVRGYPAAYGDTAVGENAIVPEDILVLVNRCVQDLKLKGILEFEFKYDLKRKRFWLIEVNPRSWSWVGATGYCGTSLCWIAYLDHIGENIDKHIYKAKYEPGKLRYVFVHKDLPNVLLRYRWDEPSWVKGLGGWLKEHRKCEKVIWADIQWDDPIPTIYTLWLTGRILLSNLYRHFWSCRSNLYETNI